MFDANLFGVMRMAKTFVHLLIASGDGRIVQIGSIAAVVPVPFGSIYNASKELCTLTVILSEWNSLLLSMWFLNGF